MMCSASIFYINLDRRPDRRQHIEHELQRIGWFEQAERFSAVDNPSNPALGCSHSHLEVLKRARLQKKKMAIVVEDDLVWEYETEDIKNKLKKVLDGRIPWKVILLGGNHGAPTTAMNSACRRVTACQTTTGYIVHHQYYDTLIQNMEEGIHLLEQYPTERTQYAIDRYWLQLQKKDMWLILDPAVATQLPGYSDVEEKNVDYQDLMRRKV